MCLVYLGRRRCRRRRAGAGIGEAVRDSSSARRMRALSKSPGIREVRMFYSKDPPSRAHDVSKIATAS